MFDHMRMLCKCNRKCNVFAFKGLKFNKCSKIIKLNGNKILVKEGSINRH